MEIINSKTLIEEIQKENLYIQTINQLNKDIQLANIDHFFDILIQPKELKTALHNFMHDLFNNSYDDYLNLMYRVDVSENELNKVLIIKNINNVNEISFLILKREFQKVWFKKKYSK